MKIGRYEIQGELGKGGMGAVLLGYDPLLDRKVAIKCVRSEAASDFVERQELERRLVREAQSAARLRHDGIVAIWDVLQAEGGAFIVMEFVAGRTLSEIAPAGRPADRALVSRVVTETAAALDHAHVNHIIHRDIKPSNIMIDQAGAVRIADFGIAKILGVEQTNPGVVVGTLGYMSPEQLKSEPLDGRADQYSLAVIAYQMLAGRPLYDAGTLPALVLKIATEAPPRVTGFNPELPPAIDPVFQKALAKNREDRFATCAEFAAALASALAGAAKTIPVAMPRYATLVGAIVAAAAIVIGGVYYFGRPRAVERVALKVESAPVPAAVTGPPANPAAGQIWQNAKDGQAYVMVPAGSFRMGCVSIDKACEPDEKPARDVNIPENFWMGQTEASVAAYTKYARETNREMPAAPPFDSNWSMLDHPMVQVTWQEADAFCKWAGGALPSEEAWEYAARGAASGQVFAMGDRVTGADAHFSGDGGPEATVAVTSFRPNGFGIYQMSGNAAEWTSGSVGDRKVVRGGSWNSEADGLRVSKRVAVDADRRNFAFGMRCMISAVGR